MKVALTWPEVNVACQVALLRQMSNEARQRKQGYGASDDYFDSMAMHSHGCVAELATAKGLNLYWSGVAGMREPDVGGFIEVRGIDDPRKRLIAHDKDSDAAPIVLAFVENVQRVTLLGWMMARDAKTPAFMSDPQHTGRPAYFAPRSLLRPMADLVAAIPKMIPQKVL